MRKKSIGKNYVYNALYQILNIMAPLITAPYLSRTLGADGVGTISFAESVVSYFTLFAALGISSYGQREISYVQDDVYKRSVAFWNAKILEFCTSGIVLLIYIVFSLLNQEGTVIYLVLSLNIIAVFFDITWFFQGLEEFGKIVARNTVIRILNIIYIFLFIRDKEDIVLYVFGLVTFTLLSNLSLWTYLFKYVERISLSALRPFRDVKIVVSLFLPTIAVQIYTVLDKTMIGIITRSSFENGYYEQAVKLSRMLLSIVTAMGPVVVPRVGYLFEKKDMQGIRRCMYRSYRFAWFLGLPICLGLILVAGNFVPWFFGAGYDKVIPLLHILALLVIVIGINNVISVQYLIPTKRQNLLTVTLMMGAATNFCLNLVLIRYFQSIGAAIASVVAESVIAIVQLILMRKEISPAQVLREGTHYYVASIAMVITLVPLVRVLSPSPLHTFMIVAVGAIAYFLVLLIEKDDFVISNVKTLILKLVSIFKVRR